MRGADVGRIVGSVGERLLQAAYGCDGRARRFYDTQLIHYLNADMRQFIGRQEMMFVATADGAGNCDATFRAGPPGFVAVLNEGQVAWPDYRGNGVMASLGNISENGHAGLLFIDFFRDLVGLHVNGRAAIVEDTVMRGAHPHLPVETVKGRRAERWVRIDVDEAYIHCRKHIPLMTRVPRDRDWGTDSVRRKGGDFFNVGRPAGPAGPADEPPEPAGPPPVTPARRRWWHRR